MKGEKDSKEDIYTIMIKVSKTTQTNKSEKDKKKPTRMHCNKIP